LKILFLHLPKTAGQSVHQLLIDLYGEQSVCPARDNTMLYELSDAEMNKYSVFSGHLDWSRFDYLKERPFTFSILRDPEERLLSFYFYLREQATIFQRRGELSEKPGLLAALHDSPDRFFLDSSHPIRNFLDQNLDNFYTYYFAGRRYDARPTLHPLAGLGKCFRSEADLVKLALINIKSYCDAVYDINSWRTELERDLARMCPFESKPVRDEYRVNQGISRSADRRQALAELGASKDVFNRISEMCVWDYKLISDLET